MKIRLALLLGVLSALIWLAALFALRSAAAEHIDRAGQEATSDARVFGEYTLATIKRLDTTMHLLRAQWPKGRPVFVEVGRQIQQDIDDIAFQITVLDSAGYSAYSSLAPSAPPQYMGDREHFRIHHDAPDRDSLFISDPLVGRISGKWSIQFARPLKPGKPFGGVILTSVSPALFEKFRDTLQLEVHASISLIKTTGQILARYPNPDNVFLQAKVSDVPYLAPDAPIAGTFQRGSQLDGISRVFGYYRLPEYGLVVVIGQAVDGAMANYAVERKTIVGTAIAATLCAFLLVALCGGWLAVRATVKLREAERAHQLAESESRFRSVINQAVAGIFMADNAGRFTLVNDYFCERLGYSRQELLGLSIRDIVHPDDRLDHLHFLERIPASGPAASTEQRYRHKNGQIIWLDVAVAPMVDDAGEPIGGVAVLLDITERRRIQDNLRESERRWESLFRNSPIGMTITRIADGRIIEANQALCQGSGYLREEITGRNPVELGLYGDAAARGRFLAPLAAGQKRVSGEFTVPAKSGALHQLLVVMQPITFDEEPCLLAAYSDNTERRRAEREAGKLRDELDRLMNYQVAKHTAMVMAHDLHQPLNAIATYLGAVNLMLENAAPADKLRGALAQCSQQVQRAGLVVRELLTYLERGRPDPEPIDVNSLVRKAVSHFEVMPNDHKRIICELAPELLPVNAIRIEIERILLNLMQNSVDAMRDSGSTGTPVTITIRTQMVKDTTHKDIMDNKTMGRDMVKVSVSDNGPGLDATARAHIFEPFWSSKTDGSGMGLTVSRAIVEAQGGQLWCDPDPNGATFHFTSPAIAQVASATSVTSAASSEAP